MRDPEESESEMSQNVWRAQIKEDHNMQVALTPDQLCAMARSREKLNAHVRSISLVILVAIAAGLLYDVYRVDLPWIRIGVAWTLCIVVYLFGPAFENKVRQTGLSEPCTRFLESEHEERRRQYLRIRNRLFLFVPGILACWFGRAPAVIKGSSTPGSAPAWVFLITAVALVLVWLAFGKAAQKAARDRDEIRRSAGY
jgi:membrane protein implicated in regulation of membrane protease activity